MSELGPVFMKPRRGLSRVEAALYVGVSASTFDKLVKDGTMPAAVHIGARLIWDIRTLDAAFDDLTNNEPEVDTWADA